MIRFKNSKAEVVDKNVGGFFDFKFTEFVYQKKICYTTENFFICEGENEQST